MPKENTHLYFADKVKNKLDDSISKDIDASSQGYYYLGSVAPDSFFYGRNNRIVAISDVLHGRYGDLTNEVIFDLLEMAKTNKDKKELAFVYGYITHCALDMVFHPVIIYLVGNIDHDDPRKSEDVHYRHRCWETGLDQKLGHSAKFERYITKNTIDSAGYYGLLEHKFSLNAQVLRKTTLFQRRINRLLHSRLAYLATAVLRRLAMVRKKDLGIFYHRVKQGDIHIPERINYRDIVSGEERTVLLDYLFKQAQRLATKRITAAHHYYYDVIDKEECMNVITGESLETGKVGCSTKEIRYTMEI